MTEPTNTWRKYLTDYNEGLGLVYERFVLNDFLEDLRQRHQIQSVLEAPLYGMAGVSGINDVTLARQGVAVTMVDDNEERLQGVRRIWEQDLQLPVNLVHTPPDRWDALPFADRSFDLTWQWAGLWYIQNPAGLLRELVRTSRNLVFVAMPNNLQVGYWLRKLADSGLPMSRQRPQSAFAAVEIVSASCSPHYGSRSGVHNELPDPRWTAEFLRHLLGASS